MDTNKLHINCNHCTRGKIFMFDEFVTCSVCQGTGKKTIDFVRVNDDHYIAGFEKVIKCTNPLCIKGLTLEKKKCPYIRGNMIYCQRGFDGITCDKCGGSSYVNEMEKCRICKGSCYLIKL